MKDISNATDLIATARDALLNDLLPELHKEQRYTGLMIANAMAIALREQQSGAHAMRGETARIRKLLASVGSSEQAPADASTDELRVLRRDLCKAIRAGQFDDDSHSPALVANLARTAADWLAISNPKALRTDHASG
jgi:Domain of unknown function (DUF6285)